MAHYKLSKLLLLVASMRSAVAMDVICELGDLTCVNGPDGADVDIEVLWDDGVMNFHVNDSDYGNNIWDVFIHMGLNANSTDFPLFSNNVPNVNDYDCKEISFSGRTDPLDFNCTMPTEVLNDPEFCGEILVSIYMFSNDNAEVWCPGESFNSSFTATYTPVEVCQCAPTPSPTSVPTPVPTDAPTPVPTDAPTPTPTDAPTPVHTYAPTPVPTDAPTPVPTYAPTPVPTDAPTPVPTDSPTPVPTNAPTPVPTDTPTPVPTYAPTPVPTDAPTPVPTDAPTPVPTDAPTPVPTDAPTPVPTDAPTPVPTDAPTPVHTYAPTPIPTDAPTPVHTYAPTPIPTDSPTPVPTDAPTPAPTDAPTPVPTDAPTPLPTDAPTPVPTDAPTPVHTYAPTPIPTDAPTPVHTYAPTPIPTDGPTPVPTYVPTPVPTDAPTPVPTDAPTPMHTYAPTPIPTDAPTPVHTYAPTPIPTDGPTPVPTYAPTPVPTDAPTPVPTGAPTPLPTDAPTPVPTDAPTPVHTYAPTPIPTDAPTPVHTYAPTPIPTDAPTPVPTYAPTPVPTDAPTPVPTDAPSPVHTYAPTPIPTDAPTPVHTYAPTPIPTDAPTPVPTDAPTPVPTDAPTPVPTDAPTPVHTYAPTPIPTDAPTPMHTYAPTPVPTDAPTPVPTDAPTPVPTDAPTNAPTPIPCMEIYGRDAMCYANNVAANVQAADVNIEAQFDNGVLEISVDDSDYGFDAWTLSVHIGFTPSDIPQDMAGEPIPEDFDCQLTATGLNDALVMMCPLPEEINMDPMWCEDEALVVAIHMTTVQGKPVWCRGGGSFTNDTTWTALSLCRCGGETAVVTTTTAQVHTYPPTSMATEAPTTTEATTTTAQVHTYPPTSMATEAPTTTTEAPTTTEATMTTAPTTESPTDCAYDEDDNLEVLLPPLLDEGSTRVRLDGASTDMMVSIIVPKQYETAAFSFRSALDNAAGFNSSDLASNLYWEIDDTSDPCNVIYTATIPWDECRDGRCGLEEHRYSDSVCFNTDIDIAVTKEIILTPHTLLEVEANGMETELLQSSEHSLKQTRLVSTTIPFEICFNLIVKLWANTNVISDHLRVASAVIESSVLTVDVDNYPIATAQLELVTVIPLPLHLSEATINVSVANLADDLSISEIVAKRDCDFQAGFCTQFWSIAIMAEQCTLDGQYVAVVTGACHPDADNCLEPNPDTDTIVMDITSDDFCGISQTVDISGDLELAATECNGYMEGTITVANNEGARINQTRILQVRAEPTLVNSEFMTIYDYNDDQSPLVYLSYESTFNASQPDEVKFKFLWEGKSLRCDVNAHLEVMVAVEFEATSPLLMSVTALADSDMKEETMRMVSSSNYIAASSTDGTDGTDGTDDTDDSDDDANSTSAAAATRSPSMLTVMSIIVATLVASVLRV